MDYWVNKINLLRRYDSGCPIFLIGTHSDNSSCTKTYKDNIYKLLKERYPLQRFKGLYEEHIMFVSTTDYDGIAQLRDRMIELITVTKYSEKMFPQITSSNWLVVKDVLLQLQCTFGFQPDIIKLMKLSGIGNNSEDEINECVQFLMSTADILAFQINKRNLYILDIVWFAETIRELISVNNSLIKNGILSISDITNSLQQVDKKFAQIFKYLLESFQIVYKLPNSNSVMVFYLFHPLFLSFLHFLSLSLLYSLITAFTIPCHYSFSPLSPPFLCSTPFSLSFPSSPSSLPFPSSLPS